MCRATKQAQYKLSATISFMHIQCHVRLAMRQTQEKCIFNVWYILICFVAHVCCMSTEGAEFENFQYQELDISKPAQFEGRHP
jgi:uncharacterized membrane protein YhdT